MSVASLNLNLVVSESLGGSQAAKAMAETILDPKNHY
jgi:hypothetical protein